MIRTLQKEEASVSAIIICDAVGQPPQKRRRRIYVELQQRLKNLYIDYVEGRKTLEQFLSGVGYNIRFIV